MITEIKVEKLLLSDAELDSLYTLQHEQKITFDQLLCNRAMIHGSFSRALIKDNLSIEGGMLANRIKNEYQLAFNFRKGDLERTFKDNSEKGIECSHYYKGVLIYKFLVESKDPRTSFYLWLYSTVDGFNQADPIEQQALRTNTSMICVDNCYLKPEYLVSDAKLRFKAGGWWLYQPGVLEAVARYLHNEHVAYSGYGNYNNVTPEWEHVRRIQL